MVLICTTHLLGDEAELLAYTMTFLVHRLTEILEVVGETLLLLADIQLLNVVDELLLQAVLVVVDM